MKQPICSESENGEASKARMRGTALLDRRFERPRPRALGEKKTCPQFDYNSNKTDFTKVYKENRWFSCSPHEDRLHH